MEYFADLKAGTKFEYIAGYIVAKYMKINCIDIKYNAVNLRTGNMVVFPYNEKVTVIEEGE